MLIWPHSSVAMLTLNFHWSLLYRETEEAPFTWYFYHRSFQYRIQEWSGNRALFNTELNYCLSESRRSPLKFCTVTCLVWRNILHPSKLYPLLVTSKQSVLPPHPLPSPPLLDQIPHWFARASALNTIEMEQQVSYAWKLFHLWWGCRMKGREKVHADKNMALEASDQRLHANRVSFATQCGPRVLCGEWILNICKWGSLQPPWSNTKKCSP